ncbi:glycosyltransferase family A protein [Halomonas saccharevitans]|uniref:Glycosyltransferase family A protein n=1 Tax=Halomonas saccharevitans TaxID=416872 RepID=A0ABU3NAR6_9GAMM|nr:glycosyltransferase family A protein [Halomonas saccharevitans]MDT8878296.1 glycosyltransferase family A protein [Halomonas saccharevitans]
MQDMQPTVAIIIPCFNRWPHIQEAIESVLTQTWSNTQCIVVDDASTDDSFARLKEHYETHPKVTIHQLESNQGQSAARNRGVELSDSDYIGFLDSDDLFVDTAVASRIQLAKDHPNFEGIVFGEKVDETTKQSLLPGKKPHAESLILSEYIENMGWLCTNSFIMKRKAFIDLNGFNESLRKKEDVEFFLRALSIHEARYAKGACCMVRDLDTQRARHDHERIIEQGQRFIEAVQTIPKLSCTLTKDQKKKLVRADTKSALQSLYRMKQSRRFRRTMREAITAGKIRPDFRMFKRYLLSFFW